MQISSLSRLFDISGGLIWHARALRSRQKLWRSFRESVTQFLESAPGQHQTLVLIGPSAGWCLPDVFITKFEKIICIDPDPLAPFLFGWLHGHSVRQVGTQLIWRHADFFSDPARQLDGLSDPLILLCNVAGQLFLQKGKARAIESELASLKHILSKYDWGSFHDLLSAPIMRDLPVRSYATRPVGEKLLKDYGLSGVWLDHLTGELLPQLNARMILPWQLKPDRLHLVEAGWVKAWQ
jgi:hypothetical protein